MFKRIIAIGAGVLAGYLMMLGGMQVAQSWGWWADRDADRAADQVRQVLLLLNKHYVDANEVKGPKLADHAIESMVGALDTYSEFMHPDAFKRLEEDVGGEFGGIGVQVEQEEGKVVVVAPIAGTPGARAGILRGDAIVSVDGQDTRGLKLEQFIGKLRGKPGTLVTVGVERGEPARTLEFKIKREVIQVESVPAPERLGDGIGYVRVTMFGEHTGDEFKRALDQLRKDPAGLRALVLDLRNNPGGLLTAAVAVVEPFFRRDELVVYTEGRTKEARMELRSEGRGELDGLPMVVLVNNGSASAAEIVAGALKDTKRAVLVGEKTFGKGSVQTLFPLRGGAGLRLTTAHYHTPSGVVIHEKGIEPEIREMLTPEEEKAVSLHRLRPDVTDPEVFRAKFGVRMVQDTQLAAGLRALREKLGLPVPPAPLKPDTAADSANTGTSEIPTESDSPPAPATTPATVEVTQ